MENTVMNNGKKEYTITWFIENYSYCWQHKGEPLISPKFTVESLERTVWTLQLFPKGCDYASEGKISVYLCRSEDDDGPEDLALNFELAVFTAHGKSTVYSIENETTFSKGHTFGATDLLEVDEVLLHQKANYFHQDTLTVCCKMWTNEDKIMKVSHCSARSRIGIENISFLHKVENFSSLEENKVNTLQVHSPSKTGSIISILCFIDSWSIEGAIIYKILPSVRNYVLRKLKLSLLDQSGNLVPCREIDNQFGEPILDIQEKPLSLTRQAILNKKSEYLPNDELSLICECTFSTGVELEKIEEIQYELPLTTLNQNSWSNMDDYNAARKVPAFPSALDDLQAMYNNRRLTDIELKTETKSFPAHKLVLCARSSVFNAMLTTNMKEKNTDCIQIDDLDDDIVEQLLLFLYSDDLENLQWDSAIKLYYAGDKYAIEKLKALCSSFLFDNLSTANASELLLLADTHNDSDLKQDVEYFISRHEDDVFGSEEWEKLAEINPVLLGKTMCKKYKKRGGKYD